MNGDAKVIVATNSMTRGLDVIDLEAVTNFDIPPTVKLYLHRAGRTARAGRAGSVFTILTPEAVLAFDKMI